MKLYFYHCISNSAHSLHSKIQNFWERHKIWKKSPIWVDVYSVMSKEVGDFFKFCGPLTICILTLLQNSAFSLSRLNNDLMWHELRKIVTDTFFFWKCNARHYKTRSLLEKGKFSWQKCKTGHPLLKWWFWNRSSVFWKQMLQMPSTCVVRCKKVMVYYNGCILILLNKRPYCVLQIHNWAKDFLKSNFYI